MQQKFNDQYNQQIKIVRIRKVILQLKEKNNAKSKDHNVGDYVDFEEVEE